MEKVESFKDLYIESEKENVILRKELITLKQALVSSSMEIVNNLFPESIAKQIGEFLMEIESADFIEREKN